MTRHGVDHFRHAILPPSHIHASPTARRSLSPVTTSIRVRDRRPWSGPSWPGCPPPPPPPRPAQTTLTPTIEERWLDRAVPQEILRPVRIRRGGAASSRGRWGGRGPTRRPAGSSRARGRGCGGGPWTGPRGAGPPAGTSAGTTTGRCTGHGWHDAATAAWQPDFGLTERQRAALLDALERTSRGQDSIDTAGAARRSSASW